MSRIFIIGSADDLGQAHLTQVWLATGEDATATGGYFYHLQPKATAPAVHDAGLQEKLLAACARLSGVTLPERAD
jgi:hypothetical protein